MSTNEEGGEIAGRYVIILLYNISHNNFIKKHNFKLVEWRKYRDIN